MKRKIMSTVACLAALFFVAGVASGMGDDDDARIQYVLQTSTRFVPPGQSPGLRLSVTNNSGAPVSHVLEPTAYEVMIDGPDGHRVWFFRAHIMPTDLQLQTGQTAYLFGGSATYQYPESIYFEHAGAYHIRYCDKWMMDGHGKKICSNNLEVHVGVGDADHDGQ